MRSPSLDDLLAAALFVLLWVGLSLWLFGGRN